MVEVAGFIRVELLQRGKRAWGGCVLDDGTKRLNGIGIRLEERDLGVAGSPLAKHFLSDNSNQPGYLAVLPIHTSALEIRIDPGYFPDLPLEQIPNDRQTGRTGAHDDGGTFLRDAHLGSKSGRFQNAKERKRSASGETISYR